MKTLILGLLFLTSVASARDFIHDFKKIAIPGAKCGNGDQYYIFFNSGSSEKLLVEFMGGGVCWDRLSCTAVIPKAWIYPIPNVKSFSVFTADRSYNPFRDHTMIYFPYCTGDVHAGDHVENYNGKKIHHVGYTNTLLALNFLRDQKFIDDFKSFNDVTVWGASAGAIGSLIHGKHIESIVSPDAKKTMIVDSPGLHYGKDFWKKFSKQSFKSFQRAFSNVGLEIDYNDGHVAKDIGPVFERYRDWKIGVLMGTRDVVMSIGYGAISPKEQEKLILGPKGLPAIASHYSNIKVWLKKTWMHTFFLVKKSAHMKSTDGVDALEFAEDIYNH